MTEPVVGWEEGLWAHLCVIILIIFLFWEDQSQSWVGTSLKQRIIACKMEVAC